MTVIFLHIVSYSVWGDIVEKLRIYLRWSACLIFVFLFGSLIYGAFAAPAPQVSLASAEAAPLVIIDAGHGGEDGGASDNGLLEKDVNLSVALKLRDMLTAAGYRVKMTRDEDISLGQGDTVRARKIDDTKKRVEIADSGSCLISIHQNKFTDSRYSGAQIFYSPNAPESEKLAQCMRRSITGLLQPENKRELKKADGGIYLLNNVQKSAVIVECGFLSNKEEAQKLSDEEYRRQLAFAVMCGFLEYKGSEGNNAS